MGLPYVGIGSIGVHRGKPAWHDATNTGPEQPQDLLHIADTAIKEGQLYFSHRNTQQIQDTTDKHPACYQSQHKVDPYKSPNWKFREYKWPHLSVNWNTLGNTDYHEGGLLHKSHRPSKYTVQPHPV